MSKVAVRNGLLLLNVACAKELNGDAKRLEGSCGKAPNHSSLQSVKILSGEAAAPAKIQPMPLTQTATKSAIDYLVEPKKQKQVRGFVTTIVKGLDTADGEYSFTVVIDDGSARVEARFTHAVRKCR